MDRYWFFTWRTYGTWLPGQSGFVGNYVTTAGNRVTDNRTGEIAGPSMPALADWVREHLTDTAVYLTPEQAGAVAAQLHETAQFRNRSIDALAIMSDHIHLVFGVIGDPDPNELLKDWKRYGSRPLNASLGRNRDWWARDGSTRRVGTARSRAKAICYVNHQEAPLVVWVSETAQHFVMDVLGEGLEVNSTGEPRG